MLLNMFSACSTTPTWPENSLKVVFKKLRHNFSELLLLDNMNSTTHVKILTNNINSLNHLLILKATVQIMDFIMKW